MEVQLNRRLGQNPAGAVIDVTEGEGQWLLDRGLASAIRLQIAGYQDESDLASRTKAELQTMAAELGLSTSGSKADLIDKIAEFEYGEV